MTFLLGILIGAALGAFGAHAAFNRGYALGERHGRETERELRAQWQYASPPLTAEASSGAFLDQLDRTRHATLGLNGTRAQALEQMR